MSSATQQPDPPEAIPTGVTITVWIQDDAELVVRKTSHRGQAVIIDTFAHGRAMPTLCLSPQAARALIAQLNMLDLPAEAKS